jgi:hypothetical protein
MARITLYTEMRSIANLFQLFGGWATHTRDAVLP